VVVATELATRSEATAATAGTTATSGDDFSDDLQASGGNALGSKDRLGAAGVGLDLVDSPAAAVGYIGYEQLEGGARNTGVKAVKGHDLVLTVLAATTADGEASGAGILGTIPDSLDAVDTVGVLLNLHRGDGGWRGILVGDEGPLLVGDVGGLEGVVMATELAVYVGRGGEATGWFAGAAATVRGLFADRLGIGAASKATDGGFHHVSGPAIAEGGVGHKQLESLARHGGVEAAEGGHLVLAVPGSSARVADADGSSINAI
jgi:hypothetical protein